MGNYKIRINIGIYDGSDISDGIVVATDGVLSESEAESIDAVEKALLTVNKDALVKAISQHLGEISKKKASIKSEEMGDKIIENDTKYRVDGEVGRFEFITHSVIRNERSIFDTSKDIFRTLYSKEWYRTQGFNELAFPLMADESFRKSGKKLNRVRREGEGGTPIRTLANIVEIEGEKISEYINQKTSSVLKENEFDCDGIPINREQEYGIKIEYVKTDESTLKTAIEKYNEFRPDEIKIDESQCDAFFEKKGTTVNVSIDDVGVKKQVEHREKNEVKKLKYARNTVVHIEKSTEKYLLNARSTVAILPIVIAFLLDNRLQHSYIKFFVDGEQSLHSAILKKFHWHKSFGILLDWHHLDKKCETRLSSALNNKDMRNSILTDVEKYLWIGQIDNAINVLKSVNTKYIKDMSHIDKLIEYFERNRSYIPCYALRKELGLRNSSNKGEKANDLIVSNRQKHNGMSWSKDGSNALATVTCLHLNNEQQRWFDNGTLSFKLAG